MSNGSSIPPVASGAAKPSAPQGQVVQIQTLPDALKNNARAIRVEGEVVQQNRDGSTRIKTSEGDIDVTFRGRQPQPGQTVEVEIPAGNPPRNATVRTPPAPPPLPQTPPPPAQNTAPQPTIPLPPMPVTNPAPQAPVTGIPPAPVTTQPAPAPAAASPPAPDVKPQTPLPTSYQPSAQNPAIKVATAAPVLINGQIVQLTPITAGQAQSMIQQMMTGATTPDNTITAQIAPSAVQSIKDDLQASLPQGVKPSLIQAPPTPQTMTGSQTIPAGTANTPNPVTTNVPPSISPGQPVMQGNNSIMIIQPGMVSDMSDTPDISAIKILQIDAKVVGIKIPNAGPVILNQAEQSQTGKQLQGIIPSRITPDGQGQTAKPMTISATVTGFTPQNLPIVTIQWPQAAQPQNYILQFASSNVTQGAEIILMPQTSAASILPPASALKPLMPLSLGLPLWPAGDDLFQAFFQATPQAAQILGRIIPSPANTGNFGPAAMLFIAAAKAGDLQTWMGEKKLEMIQKLGKGDLLSRLSGDVAQTLNARGDGGGNDWRSYPLPLLWQNEISRVMLHVRHEPPQNEQESPEGGTRFIFDLALTRMGEVQLDGILRGDRLDLIVRTKDSISYPMQQAMKIAYADALDGTKIYGEMTFQGDLKNWMQVEGREEIVGVSA